MDPLIDHESRLIDLEKAIRELEARTRSPRWITFSPTLYQSAAVTSTLVYGLYQLTNGIYNVYAELTCTGTGTAGNAILVQGLPAAPARTVICGSFYVLHASTHYTGHASVIAAATEVRGFSGGTGGAIGFAPSFALANTDIIRIGLRYPAA